MKLFFTQLVILWMFLFCFCFVGAQEQYHRGENADAWIKVDREDLVIAPKLAIGDTFSKETLARELYPIGSANIFNDGIGRLWTWIGGWKLFPNEMPEHELQKIVNYCSGIVSDSIDRIGCIGVNIKEVLLKKIHWTEDGIDSNNNDRSYCQTVTESTIDALALLDADGIRSREYFLWTALKGITSPHIAVLFEIKDRDGFRHKYFYDPGFLPTKVFPMNGYSQLGE